MEQINFYYNLILVLVSSFYKITFLTLLIGFIDRWFKNKNRKGKYIIHTQGYRKNFLPIIFNEVYL